MDYKEFKQVKETINNIAFTLAKMINNYYGIVNETAAKGKITKGDILDLLMYDSDKDMIRLKPNYAQLIFDKVIFGDVSNDEEMSNQAADSIKEDRQQKPKLKKFFWVDYLKDEELKQRIINKTIKN